MPNRKSRHPRRDNAAWTHRACEAGRDRSAPCHHPQAISGGTGYHVGLVDPLDFGRATPTGPASADAAPAPSSILNARLSDLPLDSSKTPNGHADPRRRERARFFRRPSIDLSGRHHARGEVTFATPAKRFHARNGQLRFLFERVQLPSGEPSALLASLESAHTSGDDRMVLDERGGATLENSKTRFIAPALAPAGAAWEPRSSRSPGSRRRWSHDSLEQSGGGQRRWLLRPWAPGHPSATWRRPSVWRCRSLAPPRPSTRSILSKGREVVHRRSPIRLQLAPGPTRRAMTSCRPRAAVAGASAARAPRASARRPRSFDRRHAWSSSMPP